MDLKNQLLSEYEFEYLNSKSKLSPSEVIKLAKYPFVSLADFCGDLSSSSDLMRVKEIEDLNIYYFLNSCRLILGEGTVEEQLQFKNSLQKEPLRTAVLLSNQETNPIDKNIVFIENACKIMLTYECKQNSYYIYNPINLKIVGTMPSHNFKSRQKLGDMWLQSFIDTKLSLIKAICRFHNIDKAFPILLMSIAYSLYKFTPSRYCVLPYEDQNKTIHRILKTYINQIKYLTKKSN